MNTFETAQLLNTIHNTNSLLEVKRCISINETEKPMEDNIESSGNKILLIVLCVILLTGVIVLTYYYYQETKKRIPDTSNDI